MDELQIPYSQKNIPQHSRASIRKQLVKRTEDLVGRMRWHLYFIRNPQEREPKETYGFRTTKSPPFMEELKDFEKDLFKMVNKVKFKPVNNNFQNQMRNDVEAIRNSNEVLVNGDKSRRIFKMEKNDYIKNVEDNIHNHYRRCDPERVNDVNKEAATIARRLELADRIDAMSESPALISIKDHKDGFPQRVEHRLINKSKSNIGAISKRILDRINCQLRDVTQINQFKSTNEVLVWFNNLENKQNLKFIKLDIEQFYPSISLDLLMKALEWARPLAYFTDKEKNTIIHCRRNFLFFNSKTYVKKDNPEFDCGIGSIDSAEVSELIGLYISHKQEALLPKETFGIFRDDMIIAVRLTGRECNLMEKKLRVLFREFGLKITVEANLTNVNYLDVNLNLLDGSYRPFRKNNDIPVYISNQSNHPPLIKKGMTKMIGNRISDLSSSEEIFNSVAPLYNQGLRNSGFNEEIKYEPRRTKQRRRARKVIYFNPPWDDSIKTNIGASFLRLVDQHFPRGSNLYHIFNRQKLKISYSNMPNLKRIISGHNNKVLNFQNNLRVEGCNCQGGVETCMLDGHCQTHSLVYKGELKYDIPNPRTGLIENKTKIYYGLTSTTFKTRYANHKTSFRLAAYRTNTTLSAHIWRLKDLSINNYNLKFSIVKLAKPYSREAKSCELCLQEKTFILFSDHYETLNRRSEILYKCVHRAGHLLDKW